MKTIEDYKKRVREIAREMQELKEGLIETISNTIRENADGNPLIEKRIGNRMCIVKLSSVIGRPLAPSFYMWEKSADYLLEWLEKKPIENWYDELKKLSENAKDGVCRFSLLRSHCGTQPIVIDKRFVDKVVLALS